MVARMQTNKSSTTLSTNNVQWLQKTVLSSIRKLASADGCVDLATIATHTGLATIQITRAVTKLEAHDYVAHKRYSTGEVRPGCYVLTEKGRAMDIEMAKFTSGPKGPTGKVRSFGENTLRAKFWRLLRARRKLSVPEALSVLLDNADDEINATSNLQKYVRLLVRSGVVEVMRLREAATSMTSNGAKRYFLIRDLGPLAPVPSKSELYDPNANQKIEYTS